MWNLLTNKNFIIGSAIVGLFGVLGAFHYNTVSSYQKDIKTLLTDIQTVKQAQLDANRKQDEYHDFVYSQTTAINDSINKSLKEKQDEIKEWSDSIIASIDDGLRETVESAVSSGTAKAIKDTRTTLRDTAVILNQKFSKQVSRDIIELVSDAERNRVALGKCIEWSDQLKYNIEHPNTTQLKK